MKLTFRRGNIDDLNDIKQLAINSWGQFKTALTNENWHILSDSLNNDKTYSDLLENSNCIVCLTDKNKIVGMVFLVSRGNPTEIYDKEWSYIRFISVEPSFSGNGIGRKLTEMCIELAKSNNEKAIALHTSELMKNARHIYETLGFKNLREIDQRLGKRYWLYKLDL